jgi:hypothetical protein
MNEIKIGKIPAIKQRQDYLMGVLGLLGVILIVACSILLIYNMTQDDVFCSDCLISLNIGWHEEEYCLSRNQHFNDTEKINEIKEKLNETEFQEWTSFAVIPMRCDAMTYISVRNGCSVSQTGGIIC